MTEASTIAVGAETGAAAPGHDEARSLASDAWRSLKKNPIFWVSMGLIVVFLLMAVWPSLFTNVDPGDAILKEARETPSADAWFGRDIQGYDIYSRTIYGARASILVGVFASIATVLIGGAMGVIAGYYGGWLDRRGLARHGHLLRHPAAARRHPVHGDVPQRRQLALPARGRQGRARAVDLRLAGPGAADAVQRPAGQAERLRPGGPRARGQPVADHPGARAARTRWRR